MAEILNKRVVNTYIVTFGAEVCEVKELANGNAYVVKYVDNKPFFKFIGKEEFYELVK